MSSAGPGPGPTARRPGAHPVPLSARPPAFPSLPFPAGSPGRPAPGGSPPPRAAACTWPPGRLPAPGRLVELVWAQQAVGLLRAVWSFIGRLRHTQVQRLLRANVRTWGQGEGSPPRARLRSCPTFDPILCFGAASSTHRTFQNCTGPRTRHRSVSHAHVTLQSSVATSPSSQGAPSPETPLLAPLQAPPPRPGSDLSLQRSRPSSGSTSCCSSCCSLPCAALPLGGLSPPVGQEGGSAYPDPVDASQGPLRVSVAAGQGDLPPGFCPDPSEEPPAARARHWFSSQADLGVTGGP